MLASPILVSPGSVPDNREEKLKEKQDKMKLQSCIIHKSSRKDREPLVEDLKKLIEGTRVLEAKTPLWESSPHNIAVRGCTLSHLSAVKSFITPTTAVLILEDDAVVIMDHFAEFLDIPLDKYPKDAGAILLGGDTELYSSADEYGFREVFPKFWGSQAVLYLPKLAMSNFLLNSFELSASMCLGRSDAAQGLCYESVLLQGLSSVGLKLYRPTKMPFTTQAETLSDSTGKPAKARSIELVAKDKPLGFTFNPDSSNGLITYNTFNIGDDIQSVAFAKLMPDVGLFIDREQISKEIKPNKTIIGGWYKHDMRDWPPHENINPLFTSFHAANSDCVIKHLDYLKKHQPIGCRDTYTVELCKQFNIEAYFSGCVTLTLDEYTGPRSNDIVVVDSAFPLDIPHKELEVSLPLGMSMKDRLAYANERLEQLAKAKCVVTTRLHTALPCLALGTPCLFVLFRDFKRFTGLKDLFTCIENYDEKAVREFIKNPPKGRPNQAKFESLRTEIAKTIKDFYSEVA